MLVDISCLRNRGRRRISEPAKSDRKFQNDICLYKLHSCDLCHIYRELVGNGLVASIYVSALFTRRGKYPQATIIGHIHQLYPAFKDKERRISTQYLELCTPRLPEA